ncbi:NACHT, LRR and PYD domains-containing protein 5-like isoform X2 [Puntigrus tetrazona]|uniref:NACHT, LRR and PYD domains-containing protein 5-like isoform X2 n=1 Tax=Puntigrus tetrazona TaxID=1606681 RepID=UPI001C8B05B2|nr:NACHT, LRR and PYD domains-containing protein 5-like isoform X2 [Puntigrus tetrazona]
MELSQLPLMLLVISNIYSQDTEDKALAVLSVSPQTWLTEGDPVTLICEVNDSSAGWTFSWYTLTLFLSGDTYYFRWLSDSSRGLYTISSAALNHTGMYACRAKRGDTVSYTNYSNTQLIWVTGVSPPVSLIISPSRTQHFTSVSLSLSCEDQSNSRWTVRRYTGWRTRNGCSSMWGLKIGFTCTIRSTGTYYTGVYWCESDSGEKSQPVNITIHSGVILESPVYPVNEGDNLILRCLYQNPTSPNLRADFYKDDSLIQSQTTEMIISTVSKSHEGFYSCKHPERGESPKSWISVTERPKAKVTIKPDQHVFRRERVTLRCDIYAEGVTRWRYSWYKDGSGTVFSDKQEHTFSSVTESDAGKYSCSGSEREGSRTSHISEEVTLTVSVPRTVLSVSPQTWLTEGDPVTLICEVNDSSAGWAFSWFTHNSLSGVSPPVSLIISPSRTQHFTSVSLSLSCEDQSNSTGWTVRRYTDRWGLEDCSSSSSSSSSSSVWGSQTGSTCTIRSTITEDTGVYWCESKSGEKSHPVNITVHQGVILESPVHSVTEGDNLTLRCLYQNVTSLDLRADFYKDESLIQSQTTEMIISTVSKSHEGFYSCKHPERGESPKSWISVTASHSGSQISVLHTFTSVLTVSLYLLVTVVLIYKCCRMRDESMTSRLNLQTESEEHETKNKTVESLWQNETPEPSCVSMKSDQSMPCPIKFSFGDTSVDLSEKPKGPESHTTKNLDYIFMELEQEIMFEIKSELKSFKKILSPDYPDCSERDQYDDEDSNKVREDVLKITLLSLRKMNQTDLANTLQNKLMPVYQEKLRSRLQDKYQRLNEGISNHGDSTRLNEIYTELYITEGGSGEVNNEHEVRQIETVSRRPETQDTPINCNDIFIPSPGQDKPIRTVLTKGVAGIGKTVSVQKFILDWAEGKANQDVHFIFPLPFRELNLMQKNFSLKQLLNHLHPETKEFKSADYDYYKFMFIFDGLDECRLSLDFQNNQNLSDVTEPASVDVLLTNLIKGNLLPSALLWITSRPAAVNQIPPECVDQVTEVRGFNDPQKEEYFRKRINDRSLADRVVTHIRSSRSLFIMCHIPVFCWISATVLERMMGKAESAEIPKTLTQMFTHFLIFQTKLKTQKYDGKYEIDSDKARQTILSLGKLASEQLEKGNLIFYEEDLKESDIDVREVSVYSGVCTQIFREEFGLQLGKVYSFVHLSIQEFLAALFKLLSFSEQNTGLWNEFTSLLKIEVDKALQSENGHWDLFLRFLLGLSLESNQSLLQGLLKKRVSSSDISQETAEYIKQKIRENPSPEKSINLFHCLNELNDCSLEQEVQTYLSRTGDLCLSGVKLSAAQWSALVFVLLNSEEELDEFKLNKYYQSEECLLRLLPVIKASRKADLSSCFITQQGWSALTSALRSNPSHLTELNLSCNYLGDLGVKMLAAVLEDPHCKLDKLQLLDCSIGEEGCAALISALRSNPSYMRELDLSDNKPGDSVVKLLSALLEDPHCKLEKLWLCNCSIGEEGCAALISALSSNSSHITELDLSRNNPGDSGVKLLSALLEDPHCKLKKLWLSYCSIGEEGCAALISALRSNSSHLRELDLRCNNPGNSGVKLCSGLMEDPHCKLKKLNI